MIMYKIATSTFDIILLCFTIFKFSFAPNPIFTLAKYTVIIYLLIKYHKEIYCNKIGYFCLFVYSFVLTYSTSINVSSFTWVLSALMSGMQWVVFFLALSALCRIRGIQNTVSILFRYTIIMLFINDISMLILPYDFSNPEEIYLIGNKFSVSYYHSILCSFCYIVQYNGKKRWLTPILIVYSGIIAATIHCTTGILITLTMAMLLFIPKWLQNILERPSMVLAAIAIENILIWSPISIFNNPILQSIMMNVFHKSQNMTGRARLYSAVLPLVSQKPLLGYGYNTDVFRNMFGYGNAQNGLFHIVIQAGIIGAIFYFGAIYFALLHKKRNNIGHGMYIYIYAMIVGSAVEINLSTLFMLGIAILYACNMTSENSVCSQRKECERTLPD